MLVTLDSEAGGTYSVTPVNPKNGEGELVQTDWDFPGLARTFGWIPRAGKGGCRHHGTDGTVTCQDCGRTASEFISAAVRYLDDHIGKTIRV